MDDLKRFNSITAATACKGQMLRNAPIDRTNSSDGSCYLEPSNVESPLLPQEIAKSTLTPDNKKPLL